MNWDYPSPFILARDVDDAHIDLMGHTNNVMYLKWMEEAAWAHSNHLGLTWERYQQLNRALVARRHEVDYLAATHPGDSLQLATWIVANDGKLSITRAYQFQRVSDAKTVLRGKTHWVCVDLQEGKPRRLPTEFVDGYRVMAG